jgi:hypothetical protein
MDDLNHIGRPGANEERRIAIASAIAARRF